MRRARIKAVATVPVRRKTLQSAAKDETNNSNDKKINENKDNDNNVNNDIKNINNHENTNNENNIINDINKNNDNNVNNDIPKNINNHENTNNENNIINDINKNNDSNVNNDIHENINNENSIINAININNDNNITNDTISTNDNKELLKVVKEVNTFTSVSKPTCESDESNIKEITIVSKSQETQNTCVIKEQSIQPESVEQITPQVIDLPEYSNTNVNVLGSPTKTGQNRSLFMRPVPRLNNSGRIRSNSIQGSGASASESEDDSKRVTNNATNNRTRNDSICSVQSNKEVYSNNTLSNSSTKTKTSQKRRILISESARKLAEARREFLLKHENKTPDRAKLTMYDLIYYNPVGNPMKTSNEPVKSSTRTESTSQIEKELEEEEEEDDPSSMPVPQVKVGADGQLVIDEQSLVIEQSHAKKSRELFAKKAIVDDDNYGSGFYKRRPKGKEWPKWETLKFYKALNIVGTDFLLMQTLFPNRTRQEIKLKYKKEERLNRRLIEKALEFHQEFSPEMEEELAKFEVSIRQQFSMEQEMEMKNKEKKKLKKRLGSRFAARSVGEIIASDEDDVMESEIGEIQYKDIEANNNQFLQKPRKRFKLNAKRTYEVATATSAITTTTTTITTTTKESGKTASLVSDPESDSDTEIYQIRPTRSGRVPKVRKLQGPDVNNLDNIDTEQQLDNTEETLLETKDEKTIIKSKNTTSNNTDLTVVNNQVNPDVITSAIPNISEVEPGSVVILSKESPEEGKTVLQVYMVSSNVDTINNQVENNIALRETNSSEILTMTTNVSSDVQSIAVKKENK